MQYDFATACTYKESAFTFLSPSIGQQSLNLLAIKCCNTSPPAYLNCTCPGNLHGIVTTSTITLLINEQVAVAVVQNSLRSLPIHPILDRVSYVVVSTNCGGVSRVSNRTVIDTMTCLCFWHHFGERL